MTALRLLTCALSLVFFSIMQDAQGVPPAPMEQQWQSVLAQTMDAVTQESGVAGSVDLQNDQKDKAFSDSVRTYRSVEGSGGQPVVRGTLKKWHPVEIDFTGPTANETDTTPNPFLDYRLNVTFTGPNSTSVVVPGFFAGDGNGNGTGSIYRVRFAPDQAGSWTYQAAFRSGNNVAISLDSNAGTAAAIDGQSGVFTIDPLDLAAPGFLSRGRLEYVGEHYLKFRDGGYWIKGGVDSPENFFGYDGFDNTVGNGFIHRYPSHVADWQAGNPNFVSIDSGYEGKAIIGALNYLASEKINSFYFLPMNLGGDGKDTYPFLGKSGSDFDNRHYDISKLNQWHQVLSHAQNLGIAAHFVLNETESANENWLDNGNLGVERKLFYRELVARFGYLLAAKWNLSEENDFSIGRLQEFGSYIAALDWSETPITVHTKPNNFSDYNQILGNPLFSTTSIQYNPNSAGDYVETWRENSAAAGRRWVLDMDENNPANTGLNQGNAVDLRKRVLYDVYFSGGNIEWYFGSNSQQEGGDQNTEDLRTRQEMYRYMWYARRLIEAELPFWQMLPADNLVTGENGNFGGAEVFALADQVYAIYLPNASGNASIDLTGTINNFVQRWYNPETGAFAGSPLDVQGGGVRQLGMAPSRNNQDWIVLLQENDGMPPELPEITQFNLIDADSDQLIGQLSPLTDGMEITLDELPSSNFNIDAIANSTTASVRFDFNGQLNFRTENLAPYALFGNSGTDFFAWPAEVGSYTLTATPFSGSGLSGQEGLPLSVAFTISDGQDADGDGVVDALDNCVSVTNTNQLDSDADGYGNQCDPDFNNDCVVNFIDITLLADRFLLTGEELYDLNSDGVINFLDVAIFSDYFLLPPGPSGTTNNCSGP